MDAWNYLSLHAALNNESGKKQIGLVETGRKINVCIFLVGTVGRKNL
tara:strand:+ start:883 stop:1023 length:141 start_codon:yes stop_codon:yes gene_type:complete